jgi:hypothetical protein
MAASIKSFEVSDLLAVLPASTDDSRQALRFKFLKELYVSLAKVGGTSTVEPLGQAAIRPAIQR